MFDCNKAQIEVRNFTVVELITKYHDKLIDSNSIDENCLDSKVVESILIRLPIKPMVVIKGVVNGSYKFEILNNKEISSILNYIGGKFRLADLLYTDNFEFYSDLSNPLRRRILNTNLTFHMIDADVTEDDELYKDLISRLL